MNMRELLSAVALSRIAHTLNGEGYLSDDALLLLDRADRALAYSPTRRSYGESMGDRMDLMERLVSAVSGMTGVHPDYEAELFDFCLHKTDFDFWAAVGKFLEYHA